MSFETLKPATPRAPKGDWFLFLCLHDGYYCVGICKEDQDFFTANSRGELWRLACLPTGWTGSNYYIPHVAHSHTTYEPRLETLRRHGLHHRHASPRVASSATRDGENLQRMLPYLDLRLNVPISALREDALRLRDRLDALHDHMGSLVRNPQRGY